MRLVRRQIARREGDGRAAGGFRHAPAMDGADAVVAQIGLDHRRRRRGAAGIDAVEAAKASPVSRQWSEQVESQMVGTPGATVIAILHDQPVQQGGVRAAARQDELRAVHRAEERHGPAVAVEEAGDGDDGVVGAERPAVAAAGGHGGQHGAAMAVQRAFRVAGGAGGEAQQAGGPFIQRGPGEAGVTAGRSGLRRQISVGSVVGGSAPGGAIRT